MLQGSRIDENEVTDQTTEVSRKSDSELSILDHLSPTDHLYGTYIDTYVIIYYWKGSVAEEEEETESRVWHRESSVNKVENDLSISAVRKVIQKITIITLAQLTAESA